MRSFASVDEMSDESVRTIKATSIDEARPLIKELLVSLVKQHIETDAMRVKVKETEAEIKKKDAILKAFLSKGASTTDSPEKIIFVDRIDSTAAEEPDTTHLGTPAARPKCVALAFCTIVSHGCCPAVD